MEKTMGSTLNALREQVNAGLTSESNNLASPTIDRPIKIGDLRLQAEAARDDLYNTGYRR